MLVEGRARLSLNSWITGGPDICPRPPVLDKSNLSYGSHSSFQMITNPKIFMVLAETTKIVKFSRLVFISRWRCSYDGRGAARRPSKQNNFCWIITNIGENRRWTATSGLQAIFIRLAPLRTLRYSRTSKIAHRRRQKKTNLYRKMLLEYENILHARQK